MTGHVLITGGTHGIGAACVEAFAAEGYRVLFSGRDAGAGEDLAARVAGSRYLPADLAQPDGAADLAQQALTLSDGRLAGLVNNAGTTSRARFEDLSGAAFDALMQVNLRAPALLIARCLPGLRAARGSVVMMSSIAGKTGEEGLALYTASKAALIGLTKALALELGPEVRVNAVCPGQVETRMMARTLALPGRRTLLEDRIPLARLGQPEEIAEAVLWLVSERSRFVTGDVLTVDGGETAGQRNPRPD